MSEPADQFYYYAGGERILLTLDNTRVAVSDADVPGIHRDAWHEIRAGAEPFPPFGLVLVSWDAIAQIEKVLRSARALRDVFRSEGSSTRLILIPEVRAEFDAQRKDEVEAAVANIVGTVPSTTKSEAEAERVTFMPLSGSSVDTFRVAQLLHERHERLFLSVSPRFLRITPA